MQLKLQSQISIVCAYIQIRNARVCSKHIRIMNKKVMKSSNDVHVYKYIFNINTFQILFDHSGNHFLSNLTKCHRRNIDVK